MDCINIYNLEVFANHGVLKEENVLGQKFIVSVNMYLDTKLAAIKDDVENTVNYADVCVTITEYFKSHTYKLIETAAHGIAELILTKYQLVEKVDVEVKKPWAPVRLPLESVSVKISKRRHTVYVGLGSNIGNGNENIHCALKIINDDEFSKVENVSSLITTKPYGNVPQDDFVNGAACIKTLRSPKEFLELIGEIEVELKRVRMIHWGPRTIDVDILLYDDIVMNTDDLVIPHYDMTNRDFVLGPLSEIAPGVIHPVYGKTITCLYEELGR